MANTFKFGNGEWAVGKETALAYNDENSNFKPLPFTFDRASTATVVNKDGLIETVGTDEPRIDFFNNTKGHLLLEPSRTNTVTYSEKADEWGRNNSQIPILDTSINNPYGVAGAYTTSGNGTANFPQYNLGTINATSSGTATVSVFLKQYEAPYIHVIVTGVDIDGFATSSLYKFTFATETLSRISGADADSTSVQDYGNGWYRIILTYNYDGNADFTFRLRNYNGSAEKLEIGTSKTYAWGAQAEEGSYDTSYIPTSGQSGGVTRSAESCSQTPPDGVIGQTEGVLYFESKINAQGTYTGITLSDGGTNNEIIIRFTTTDRIEYYLRSGGTQPIGGGTTLFDTDEYVKVAFAYKSGDSAVYINGNQVTTSTTTTMPVSLTKIKMSRGNGTGVFDGKVKNLRVYNTRLTNTELQALTT
jgi:hypothetical protein